MKKTRFNVYIIVFVYAITPLLIIYFNPYIFLATNDDGIFVSILESNLDFLGQNNLIYTSIVYGFIVKIFYTYISFLQWHGFIMLMAVALSLIFATIEIIKLKLNIFINSHMNLPNL